MHSFDYHGYSKRLQGVLDAVPDLLCQPFLDLKATGKSLHDPGNFAEAGNLPFGDVGDVGLADEGEHMVLAEREEFYVLHNDHMVVRLVEKRAPDYGLAVLEIALGKELHSLGHPFRSLVKSLTLSVFPQQGQDLLDMGCNCLGGLFVVLF